MRKLAKLLLVGLLLASCSDDVMMVDDDCFCKETSKITTVYYGVSRLDVMVETPIGEAEPYDWVEVHKFNYDGDNDYQVTEVKVECKKESEWFNYYDRGFFYDNEWFLCSYYVPYPTPIGINLDDYKPNCLRE